MSTRARTARRWSRRCSGSPRSTSGCTGCRGAAHGVFGETRKVSWQSMISVGGALYSVPHELIDQRVWARVDGDELIVVHVDGPGGPREVARHRLTTPGRPSINDEHYPPRPAGALERRPRARSEEERAFLQIGHGAEHG